MKLGPAAKAVAKNLDSGLRDLIEKLITVEVRGPYARDLLSKLRHMERLAVASRKGLSLAERLLTKSGDFFKVSKVVEYRLSGVDHLFGEGLNLAKRNQARAGYFRLVDEINDLSLDPSWAAALADRAVRDVAEATQKQLTQNVSFGVFERYGDLTRETKLLNKFTSALIPEGEFKPAVTYAAHHIIEERMYSKFDKDWRSIGWEHSDDMMATAISYEAHTYSPQKGKLPGFPSDLSAPKSFSKRLEETIGLPKEYRSVDALVDAYIEFYDQPLKVAGKELSGSAQLNRIVRALRSCKRELRLVRG